MITVGGFFCDPAKAKSVRRRVEIDLPFLLKPTLYNIEKFNLTERERAVFDLAATKVGAENEQSEILTGLGFKPKEIAAYCDLIRFLPRYHESII